MSARLEKPLQHASVRWPKILNFVEDFGAEGAKIFVEFLVEIFGEDFSAKFSSITF